MKGPGKGHHWKRRDPLGDLRLAAPSVDFTAPIMSRLGLPAAGSRAARLDAIRRWAGRTLLGAALAFAVATGFLIHARSVQARRPVGPTLPAAIRNDLDRHQHAISATIQTIRQFQPRLPAPVAEPRAARSGPDATTARAAVPAPPQAGGPAPAPGPAPGTGRDPEPGSAQFPESAHPGRGQA